MDVKSFVFLNCFCLLILYFNPFVEGDISDNSYGLCINPECSVPISRGVTNLNYNSPDDNRISFGPNEEVQIYVKEYGSKKDLWGVVIKGNKGYVSKSFIREVQVFGRDLVPAHFEFKSSLLITNSYAVSSLLHVSSHSPQSDTILNEVPQSVMHSGQNNFISSAPSEFMNSVPSNFHQEWNSHSENLQASHLHPNLNPNSNFQFDSQSRFDQSSQFHNVPIQASHLHFDSRNILSPSDMTGVNSGNIFPSPTHMPNAMHSQYQSPPNDGFFGNSINNGPNLGHLHVRNIDPNSGFPNQDFSGFNQHSSVIQQQHFQQPQNMPEMHSSFHSSGNIDDDMSKTYAMLSNMGYDNTGMYANQEAHVHQSSQNVERNLNIPDYSAVPSQSHYIPVQGSDASFYSSNFNPQHPPNIGGDTLFHSSVNIIPQHPPSQSSDASFYSSANINPQHPPSQSGDASLYSSANIDPQSLQGSGASLYSSPNLDMQNSPMQGGDTPLHSSSINPQHTEENIGMISNTFEGIMHNNKLYENNQDIAVEKEHYIEKLTHEESLEEKGEVELLAESDDVIEEEEDADEEDEDIDISTEENLESNFNLQSSMSSTQMHSHTSKEHEDVLNSGENSVTDSSLVGSSTTESVSVVQSSISENAFDKQIEQSNSLNVTKHNLEETVDEPVNSKNSEFIHEKVEVLPEAFSKKDVFSDLQDRNNNDALLTESNMYDAMEHTTPQINDFFIERGQTSDDEVLSSIDIDAVGDDLTTYQNRNLKGEFGGSEEQQSEMDTGNDENNIQLDSDSYASFSNWFDALRSVVDSIMSWIPEPLYSALMDLQNKGISPRVPVFTTLCGFTCILLIVPVFFVKERSKESRLSAQLANVEKNAYTLSATNAVLEEKLESVQSELGNLQTSLSEEKTVVENLKIELENQAEELENTKAELESCLELIDTLRNKEKEYLSFMRDFEKEKECYVEHKDSLDKIMKDQENSITSLTDQLQESENRLTELEKEKEQFLQLKADYEEKLAQFDRNCNQLLQEAEVWNARVKELTEEVNDRQAAKEELMATLKDKDEEIESLKELVETFKAIDEVEDPEEQAKTKEEKLQFLLNNAMIANQLKKEEEKSKLLDEQLGKEKNRILDMEVELLEAKSEIDKLKMSYNQALQDKAEAQTKLDVLTNYFKDKEIQLQRQLGAQEAVRQKKEEDANSAERRICLIEQENASYKSQVASMKQEMEETERTLKSQIATQEKKAHENWIAARAAERKLEDMKQEVTQLRQRLTLLEREQENWANAPRDEVIRPVPKRIPGVNDESINQDLNTSERGMFPLPFHDRMPLPPPPMMLPPDRPLPPLPPPFLPPMDRFRPQPWHMPPDHSSDYRTTPPEFMAGRELTPPRGRQSTITDGDTAPNTSSPLTTDTRDSRNSTPPHLLPDFHDVPPQPGRPFFPPPLGRARFPIHPQFRRDAGPDPKRLDNPNEFNPRGSQQPPPPEQWQHSRV